jgi:acetylornithine deacetylase/succinyl-diaminopimelate desuccinylase-like protein
VVDERPVGLLQRLLRFDTSNPPGGERECIEWIRHLLEDRGCSVRIVARDAERPNLIARLPGAGSAPPLLLQGHVDRRSEARSPTATCGDEVRST